MSTDLFVCYETTYLVCLLALLACCLCDSVSSTCACRGHSAVGVTVVEGRQVVDELLMQALLCDVA